MTNATNNVARVAAAVAGFGLVAMSFAPLAGAQTMTTTTTTSTSSSMMFTRDLTVGSTGADVTALQTWLIGKGFSIPAGATGYFGAQTKAALAAYQAANAITPAVGYFGPITRAKVMAMGGSTGGNNGGSSDNDDDDDDNDNDDLDGGESSLEDLNATSGDDDDVSEGSEADVAEFEFDVEDADIEIDRLDLSFESDASGSDEDEPWETFDTITIMDEDGEELTSEDVSDEDDWLEEDDEPYVFRFTNLNYVVREGDMGKLMIRVEAQDGIDGLSGSNDISWTVFVDTDGIRGTDGEGIEQYLGDDSETVTFDVSEEGSDDDLSVRRSSEDPDGTTLQVEDNSTSDWYTIFAFELDSDEDSDDIEINDLPIVISTLGSSTASVVNDLMLEIDGEEFDDFDRSSATTSTTTYTFDIDGDYVIEGGDRVVVKVMAEFRAQTASNYPDGQLVFATVNVNNPNTSGDDMIEAEGADDVTVDGAATGDTHTLRNMGVDVNVTDVNADTIVVDGSDNDYANFEVVVDIEAFEQDVFISKNAATSFTYQIEDGNGNVATTSTATSSSITSTADEEGNYYVIDEGSTEEFKFKVTYNPIPTDEGKFYRLQVLTINYNDTEAAPDTVYTAQPLSDFETDATIIND